MRHPICFLAGIFLCTVATASGATDVPVPDRCTASVNSRLAELIQSGRRGLPIQYLGIGGTPFKRLRDKVPDNYWIPMDEAERSHFELIQRLYPHLEEIVGLKELAELRRGRKLEVEAIAAQQQGVTKFTRFLDAI